MFYISEIKNTAPAEFKTELQKRVYSVLNELGVAYERVNTDEAISMEECVLINEKLNMQMVKTLFLCNRQKTDFYLFITTADKPFNSKKLSNILNISRLSFAPAELLQEMLGTKIGSATIFSTLLDENNKVKVLLDKDVTTEEYYGCSDGTTTGYIKIKTEQIINGFLPFFKHDPIIVEL
ncbi:prolyl-tRNA synthetase associated domain-containing protein [Flavobacterium sp. GSP11]|uniref:prolyl-tRNA synthetase associated domain-containing protein n=1 Tax=Flavobacterium sp. GSP11 TaxID=3401730 RepID=UPI003AADDE09